MGDVVGNAGQCPIRTSTVVPLDWNPGNTRWNPLEDGQTQGNDDGNHGTIHRPRRYHMKSQCPTPAAMHILVSQQKRTALNSEGNCGAHADEPGAFLRM